MLTGAVLTTTAVGLGLPASAPAPRRTQLSAHHSGVFLEQVHSHARNQLVNIVTIYPDIPVQPRLPVCLMLHGRFGDAEETIFNLPYQLNRAVTRGDIPPMALFTVDGGENNYWHQRPGDDPMAMLLDEVPRWLAERGFGGPDSAPFAVAGISMGGFGALLYTRRRREIGMPLRKTAVISPALLTSWREMRARGAFSSHREWVSLDPLRHVHKLGDASLGVWCGTEDRFVTGVRRFIRKAQPDLATLSPGGHTGKYFRSVLPDLVRFVGGN